VCVCACVCVCKWWAGVGEVSVSANVQGGKDTRGRGLLMMSLGWRRGGDDAKRARRDEDRGWSRELDEDGGSGASHFCTGRWWPCCCRMGQQSSRLGRSSTVGRKHRRATSPLWGAGVPPARSGEGYVPAPPGTFVYLEGEVHTAARYPFPRYTRDGKRSAGGRGDRGRQRDDGLPANSKRAPSPGLHNLGSDWAVTASHPTNHYHWLECCGIMNFIAHSCRRRFALLALPWFFSFFFFFFLFPSPPTHTTHTHTRTREMKLLPFFPLSRFFFLFSPLSLSLFSPLPPLGGSPDE